MTAFVADLTMPRIEQDIKPNSRASRGLARSRTL